ncbi:hypothetical protein [Haloarchaeobius sp. DFWS5]|uniref:hypothetical protein n=1 Tax=Haloarchaeobius sp. DFWS5 TaxID=3446114 RepID=UPI003EBE8232
MQPPAERRVDVVRLSGATDGGPLSRLSSRVGLSSGESPTLRAVPAGRGSAIVAAAEEDFGPERREHYLFKWVAVPLGVTLFALQGLWLLGLSFWFAGIAALVSLSLVWWIDLARPDREPSEVIATAVPAAEARRRWDVSVAAAGWDAAVDEAATEPTTVSEEASR